MYATVNPVSISPTTRPTDVPTSTQTERPSEAPTLPRGSALPTSQVPVPAPPTSVLQDSEPPTYFPTALHTLRTELTDPPTIQPTEAVTQSGQNSTSQKLGGQGATTSHSVSVSVSAAIGVSLVVTAAMTMTWNMFSRATKAKMPESLYAPDPPLSACNMDTCLPSFHSCMTLDSQSGRMSALSQDEPDLLVVNDLFHV